MIITKTPLRLSFVGGGSDIREYYKENGGAVLSTSIDKFIYITVNKRFDHTLRISYAKTEEVDHVDQIEHRIVRTVLQKLDVDGGLEITSIADVPSRGSGLGSSSSFTVGLLHAVHAFKGEYRSKNDLAAEACEVEIEILGEPIGKQDQYGGAMGGLNIIRFNPDETVDVEPVIMPPGSLQRTEESMLMFYTGITRSASALLEKQTATMRSDQDKRRTMDRMVGYVDVLARELNSGNVDALGEILHENWLLKKSLSEGISNPLIDDSYEAARKAGALGGKLLGAGGGGFMVFYAPRERHSEVIKALSHLRPIDLAFDRRGSSVIFYHN